MDGSSRFVRGDYVEARHARQTVLIDAVWGIVIWVSSAFLLAGFAWALAHLTVVNTLPRSAVALPWAVLGGMPVWFSEQALRRTAAGVYLRRCTTGPMPRIPVEMPVLPGAPWFGPSHRVRGFLAVAAGLTCSALEWHVAPLAGAVAGSIIPFFLCLRGSYAAVWICDFKLQQHWNKRK
eukprot:TRINITY_DN43590_c0_g1_i1.p2 TRINITY_DN43590_c0_g1~~TRINITY_DN43590_c0_g1_i1.p2  ORF type:complete len:179 (-),score=19.92 TRINITY_DN43590_c0_g1_i1:88-624(-)